MPMKALRFCAKCSRLAVSGGLCEAHRKQYQQQRNNKWLSMYHDPRWLTLRDAQLRKDPLCCECRKQQRLTPANTVDHIRPHKGDPNLFYDPDNLSSMCASCHSSKTDREDQGFGNKRKK